MNEMARIPLAAAPVPPPVVRLRGFSRRFGATRVLDDLNLTIAPGEFVALLGRSGSGKTTPLLIPAGLDDDALDDHALAADEQDILVPAARATVFQDARLLPWKRVWKNVVLGLAGRDLRAVAEETLREVGLEHRVDAWPLTPSGGEARAGPPPRAVAVRRAVRRARRADPHPHARAGHAAVRAHRPAVLLVTHGIEEAMAFADRILVVERGRIAAEEIVAAARDRRSGVVRTLRSTLLGHLGLEHEGGVYADMIGRDR